MDLREALCAEAGKNYDGKKIVESNEDGAYREGVSERGQSAGSGKMRKVEICENY